MRKFYAAELETAGRYDANRAGATAVGDESPSETSFNSSFCEPSRQQLTHDMHMLRFKLLCFANSFENYIMTRVHAVYCRQSFRPLTDIRSLCWL